MDPAEALTHIRTLANIGRDSDDIELARKHFQLILDIITKATTRMPGFQSRTAVAPSKPPPRER